jgi:signal transduction histidine kinase
VTTRSIRRELILAVILSQALLAIGLTCAGVLFTRHRVQASLDTALQAHAMSVAALIRYPEDRIRQLYFESELAPGSIDGIHADIYEVSTEALGVVGRSFNASHLTAYCVGKSGYSNVIVDFVPYRLLCLHNVPILDRENDQPSYPLTVAYASGLWQVRSEQRAAGVYIAVASLLLMSTTTLLALWGVRRGLLPLRQLAEQASRVSAQQWEFRSPQDAKLTAELRPLTDAMQTMLQRLQASFQQQREFLGNAAHELKTPVAILKSTLQALVQKQRTSAEYQAGIRQALDDMERLEKLLRWMLRLARAEQWSQGALRRELGPVNLASTCESAMDALRVLAQANGNQIQFTADRHVFCQADPEDLETVWVNLLENAIRYSPHGASIRIRVAMNGDDRAKVVVEDQGPGIPAAELDHIFERFHRGDPSRARETGGFGLGLAISKALVETYGGNIRVHSEIGKGTQMTVELPSPRNRS